MKDRKSNNCKNKQQCTITTYFERTDTYSFCARVYHT